MIQLLKVLATPVVWILILMFLGLILTRRPPKKKRYRLGRCALFFALGILYLLSTNPVSDLLIYSLEYQYPVPSEEVLSTLDVVVVLGGGMSSQGGFRKCPEPSGAAYSRLYNGIRIFRQSGADILAFSGGGSKDDLPSESEVMKTLALELGVREDRMITEGKSRNTMENGAELAKLLSSRQAGRIGLVTSALHMPRSVKVFRRQFPNSTIVPLPVNHLYSPDWRNPKNYIPSSGNLSRSNNALHEWIGMVWYVIKY